MNAELKELAKQAGELAQAQNIKIATAESCTGGLVAAALTHWPGASAWFEQGVISYSNAAKIKLLGVSEKLLERYGAVSEETAAAMCTGVGGHIALAITGIAGPDGGDEKKSVGMVCFGWCSGKKLRTETQHFVGDRTAIQYAAACHALRGVIKQMRDDGE